MILYDPGPGCNASRMALRMLKGRGYGRVRRYAGELEEWALLGWLPFIGWIFSMYRLYLATVGIREMHSTTTGRALLVVVLPAILFFRAA